MKIVRIPKRKLLFAALATAALVGVALAILDSEARSGGVAGARGASVALTEAEVEAVTSAAGRALGEIMRFDHAEGREAWEARIKPLCTPNGLAFWAGPFFAGQVWPAVMEQAYTTQAVEVIEVTVLDEGDSPGSVVAEVTLSLTYVLGESEEPAEGSAERSVEEQKTNQVVMVHQDGQWLVDGPPAPSYWSSEE